MYIMYSMASSSVCLVTGYRLDNRGLTPGKVKMFLTVTMFTPVMEFTQAPNPEVPTALPPGVETVEASNWLVTLI
jgi:hypothetical protein